jgi:hypothetical protein
VVDISVIVDVLHFDGDVVVVKQSVAANCVIAGVTETWMLSYSGVLLLLGLGLYFAVLFVI